MVREWASRVIGCFRLLEAEHSVAVLVTDQNRLVGIFTERDILYRTALEGDPEAPIGEAMTRELVTLRSDQRVTEAIRTMTEEVAGTYSAPIHLVSLVEFPGRGC